MGSIRKRGKYWRIRYYDARGIQVEETTHSTKKGDAVRLLKLREGALARGEPVTNRVGKVTFVEAAADVTTHYEVNGLRSLPDAKRRIDKHLTPFFGRRRMTSITTSDIRAYVAQRQRPRPLDDGTEVPGAAAASINRELALLKRAFRLAKQAGKLLHAPYIPMLKEAPPRRGFIEREAYDVMVASLPPELNGIVILAFWSGWRRSEILGLQWRQVDRRSLVIRLDPGTTKNGQGRTLPYGQVPELVDAMEQQWAMHTQLRGKGVLCPHVFHRDGRPVRGFYRAWKSACKAAGCPGAMFHDFRRTAARNLIRAGVSEKLAMEILGHKTASIFKRYQITTEDDKREALGQMALATRAKQGRSEGTASLAGRGEGS